MIGPKAINELLMNMYTRPFYEAEGGTPTWAWTVYETEIMAAKSPLLKDLISQAGSTDAFVAATRGGGLNPRLWPYNHPDPLEPVKPPEPTTPGPGEPTSPGMPPPGQPAWFDAYADLIRKMAAKLGVAALLLCVLALPAFSQINVTFAWDASDSVSTPTHPISYRLYSCADEALTQCVTHETGQALEKQLTFSAGSQSWIFARCYWDAVEGQPTAGVLESGNSNVLLIRVFSPPGNPKNPHVKVVTVAEGKEDAPSLTLRAE